MADPLKEKSFAFALRITKLTDLIQKERREFTLSRKVLDSSVNIGLLSKKLGKAKTAPIFDRSTRWRTKKPSRVTT